MSLKSALKSIKLNESLISMVLGAIVIVVVGVLVVNYFSARDAGDTLPTGETTTTVEGPTITRNGETYHIIQPNETLWEISERYYDTGYNWTQIAEVNNLSSPNQIEEGEELLIPEVEDQLAEGNTETDEVEVTKQPTTTATPTPTITTENQEEVVQAERPIAGATYTVERGDTLWDIAVRAYGDGFRWVDIAEANDLANPNLIHNGNVFEIPR